MIKINDPIWQWTGTRVGIYWITMFGEQIIPSQIIMYYVIVMTAETEMDRAISFVCSNVMFGLAQVNLMRFPRQVGRQ